MKEEITDYRREPSKDYGDRSRDLSSGLRADYEIYTKSHFEFLIGNTQEAPLNKIN